MKGATAFEGSGLTMTGEAAYYVLLLWDAGMAALARLNAAPPQWHPAARDAHDAMELAKVHWSQHRGRQVVGPSRPSVPTNTASASRSTRAADDEPRPLTDVEVGRVLGIDARHVVRVADRIGVTPLPGGKRPRRWDPTDLPALHDALRRNRT